MLWRRWRVLCGGAVLAVALWRMLCGGFSVAALAGAMLAGAVLAGAVLAVLAVLTVAVMAVLRCWRAGVTCWAAVLDWPSFRMRR